MRAAPHTLLRLAGMGTRTYLEERIRALGRRMLASADEWASDCRRRPSGCPTQWWCLPGVRRSHRGPVHDDYRGRGLYQTPPKGVVVWWAHSPVALSVSSPPKRLAQRLATSGPQVDFFSVAEVRTLARSRFHPRRRQVFLYSSGVCVCVCVCVCVGLRPPLAVWVSPIRRRQPAALADH